MTEVLAPFEDKPREHCGVVGAIDLKGNDIVRRGAGMLSKIQHRGQDSAGILTKNDGLHLYKKLGRVSRIFTDEVIKEEHLVGPVMIGHTRYKIQGGDTLEYTQPLIATYKDRQIGLAHNGNIPALQAARRRLRALGIYPDTNFGPDFDSNILAHLIVSAEGDNWIQRIQNGLLGIRGSYSLTILTDDGHLLAVRDPWGNRPLSVATIEHGYVISSETSSFRMVAGKNIQEVNPGQIIDFSNTGVFSSYLLEEAKQRTCVLERVYFAYEHSKSHGLTNAKVRESFGKTLAQYHPGSGTIVCDVPQSSTVAAESFAYETGKKHKRYILKDPDSLDRSFMKGEMGDRVKVLEAKFNVSDDIAGEEVDMVDDSVIIGNTMETLAKDVYAHGAKSIHLRIYSEKIIRDCNWGVTMRSSTGEFAAIDQETGRIKTNPEIAQRLGVDSIEYNSLKEMKESLKTSGDAPNNYCYFCFGGVGLGRLQPRKQYPKIEEFTLLKI